MEQVQRLVSPILGIDYIVNRNNKHLMELKYIVYITINQCNGKFYIGVHKTNPEIFDGYIGGGITSEKTVNKDTAFHNAVKKYGYKNFKRTTIQIFPYTDQGRSDAYKLEKEIVTKTLLKSKQCYNTALGGLGSISLEKRKAVYMFDLNGEYLRTFSCVTEAAEYLGLGKDIYTTAKSIRNNCLGTTSSSFGYYWSYKKEFNYSIPNHYKKVAQYTLSGKFLRYYESITEAENVLGISTIKQAIKKRYSAGGYQWRYYTGDTSDIPKLISTATKNKILPIIMYDTNMNKIKDYSCVRECKEEHPEFTTSQINRVLAGVLKTHHGYIFKYKDEDIV